ncbi:hypothetical protein JZO77_17285 [Enterococcus hulanensis]|uniref:hypothetical protein n=1 Tax=Enterococcus hulanensis TaxID=2559929 RepID=UPI001A8F625E|nr:hypothetical protein [Enterococcus hulanensis]MBO0458490.1 hypothetical protein [Enterococcus hulanensis]
METWAVVCGAVREELELRLVIDKLLEMRESELISGILLSTWNKEFDRFSELRKQLEDNDIRIIEQAPLESRMTITRTNSINYMRQALQFQAALDQLPNDCFVLKARTDRSLHQILQIEDQLLKEPKKVGFSNEQIAKNMPHIFEYKMTIFNARIQRIFNFSDFVFWGHISDVRKLINFNLAELNFNRDLVANTQWFLYPFSEQFPIIRDYFRFVNFRPLIFGMKEYFDQEQYDECFPEFFYRVYASYLLILSYYFNLVDMKRDLESVNHKFEEGVGADAYHFLELFKGNKSKGFVHSSLGCVLLNNEAIEKVLDKDSCAGFSSDEEFHEALEQDALFNEIRTDEFQELSDFEKNQGWNISQHWLRRGTWKGKMVHQSQIYKEDVLVYDFRGLNQIENQSLLEELKEIDRTDIYLYSYWLDLPKLGWESIEQMVIPLARTQNQEAVLMVSRLLRANGIQDKKVIDSMSHLIQVTYGVRKQRGTANIKTCQIMIDFWMYKLTNEKTTDIYKNGEIMFVLDRYLEKEEFEIVRKEKFSLEELVNFLYALSDSYREKGRGTRALRLLELATELAFDKDSMEKVLNRYIKRDDQKNALLTRKTLTLFS